ncbi:histidine phosphatase family protein [Thermoanaerobacter sp. A7A]|uniref:histidine phosphatase family protein n=1 Tax=Thermoanaerobacter sp. A7A TaxID=1350366 RepID=UPI0003FD7C73|nr:histidine phosphatase family protein [Thermoanaerobacter sp. A7A]
MVDFANKVNLPVITVPDFRECKVDSEWIDDFDSFARQQWQDFNFKLSDGESLSEVQQRGIAALKKVLENYKNQNIAIGTHGTILSTIINFYDKSFGYNEFNEIKHVMPWIVKFEFDGDKCIEIEKINIFKYK